MSSACQTVNSALGLREAQEVWGGSFLSETSTFLDGESKPLTAAWFCLFPRFLVWRGAEQGEFTVWWSSGPVSPWCSTAYASWTEWWCHRVSAEGPAGNLLQRPAVSRWGAGSLPGSSRQQDTGNQATVSASKTLIFSSQSQNTAMNVCNLYWETLNTHNGGIMSFGATASAAVRWKWSRGVEFWPHTAV